MQNQSENCVEQIRLEQAEDLAHIHLVNPKAFAQAAEAELVDKLCARGHLERPSRRRKI